MTSAKSSRTLLLQILKPLERVHTRSCRRFLHQSSITRSRAADFAFAFDIDGVLVRGSRALPKASQTLNDLQAKKIPFVLLTNGGGYHEEKRAQFLSEELQVSIDSSMVLQSHTPFQDLHHLKDKTVLVMGGDHDNCRHVAYEYGFRNVILPSDIFTAYPNIWPFSKHLSAYHAASSPQPLPFPISPTSPSSSLKIDAIFVYNDPRDWGLDASLLIDCLLSSNGLLGTLSPKNGAPHLPNRGYLQDGQPHIYFSNPDLWFAAEFGLPRLGQGGFRAAFEGLWRTVSGNANLDGQFTVMGKPSQATYEFAERRLIGLQKRLFAGLAPGPELKRFYMVGDNPASDIAGANNYRSPFGTKWSSLLVKTGVWDGVSTPVPEPTAVVGDVGTAVEWGLECEGWNDSK